MYTVVVESLLGCEKGAEVEEGGRSTVEDEDSGDRLLMIIGRVALLCC